MCCQAISASFIKIASNHKIAWKSVWRCPTRVAVDQFWSKSSGGKTKTKNLGCPTGGLIWQVSKSFNVYLILCSLIKSGIVHYASPLVQALQRNGSNQNDSAIGRLLCPKADAFITKDVRPIQPQRTRRAINLLGSLFSGLATICCGKSPSSFRYSHEQLQPSDSTGE